ncbi:MAG: hypothetical protein A3I05_00740 [Deltaproteobacteria bacterium RIFCSPLOWO2_02_FULL_44_10]|nr:MAG: hypothetical protein A3I05_00740 [Deltaproteobacteria bacterium RIFCSPLOWO2_02_FULL_44_10]
MPWKESNIMSERMCFVSRLIAGERMTDLCREYGISRKTGYKFWGRYKMFGPNGLCDESRAPITIPHRTSAELQKWIIEWKEKHPTWGAKKIKVELERSQKGLCIPSFQTVHNILLKAGHVKRRKQRRRVPGYAGKLKPSVYPNEIWGADFKGEFLLGNQKYCYPLTISDHYSRYLLCCDGLETTRHRGVRGGFQRVFEEYGLPERIRVDNGSPFASKGIGGYSKLSVWWMRLGVNVERIEPGHPEQNGRHERFHLTLKQETTRPSKGNFLQQQERFDRFQEEYNNERPHEALDMKRPAEVYQKSKKSFPSDLQPLHYPLHDLQRKVSTQGMITSFGRGSAVHIGAAFSGENIGLREVEPGRWLVTFMHLDLGYVDQKTREFETII